MIKISIIIVAAAMFDLSSTYAQMSFSFSGVWDQQSRGFSLFNSFENNPSNFSRQKDWGLSFSYGGEFSDEMNSNLYSISLSKALRPHFISLRYTPGYQKEFIFNQGETFISDSSAQHLSTSLSYKELFGLGYSYKFSENFSAGFTLRFFTQEFSRDEISAVFLSDTLYLQSAAGKSEFNFWKSDIGINYFPSEDLSFSLSSINLLNFTEDFSDTSLENYRLRTDKGILFGLSYSPFDFASINLLYETNNSFQIGTSFGLDLAVGNIGAGVNVFHDEFQSPFIAGINPAISYSNNLFAISLSGVKYFSERSGTESLSSFVENGIRSLINNPYSFDKVVVTFSLALNTITEQRVKLIDVENTENIYPSFSEKYIDEPFAVGRAVNLTGSPLTVKPLSRIIGVNDEAIQSPLIALGPGDTVSIPFYTIIPENYSGNKTEISYAEFLLSVEDNEYDDRQQKPILVNGVNAWDGNVSNLKYFILKDMNFSRQYAGMILNRHKTLLDTSASVLSDWNKARVIFNEWIKDLSYIADPRASAEYVQFPSETVEIKGGDCDDLSVCYSSLLESVGVQTAIVDYRNSNLLRHVNVLVNTRLSPLQANYITGNEGKYFIRKNETGNDEVWIAVETTSLTDFNTAWDLGAQKFNEEGFRNLGLAKGRVEIIDIN